MSENYDRRNFLRKSVLMSAMGVTGMSFEEKALLAAKKPAPKEAVKDLPKGKIGNIEITRLILGGNLISGFAHSRELIYVASVLKHYFTDDKIVETLRIAEENGINTAILRTDKDTVRCLNRFRKEGGKIQWIAQTYPKEHDITSNIQMAIDNGAIGAYAQGGIGDKFYKNGRMDLLGEVVSFIKKNGLIAGVGSHLIDVQKAAEKEGIDADFYFKTWNTDGYCCTDAEETVKFMKKNKKPWIAYKILGAGVTNPKKGFKDAYKLGADFINVGMYDFQIKEDTLIAKRETENNSGRERPWSA